MNKDSRDNDYPIELESQFILRLPEEPAKLLKGVLKSGENFKNRLTIQIENDMRHGEVRFDHWLFHGKIVDLPTIVESLKTIDRKSVYKTADISQLMICKEDPDPSSTEDESPVKNKKKDPLKVDKKYLWPHGITPPTKNVRKRRFRKTLRKKCAEAPEIEKEVKRLLRADNEADSVVWEIVQEEPPSKSESCKSEHVEKVKTKKESKAKHDTGHVKQSPQKVEDIFGGTLSDSDLEDENVNVDIEDSRMSAYDEHYSETSIQEGAYNQNKLPTQFSTDMFFEPQRVQQPQTSRKVKEEKNIASKRQSAFETQAQHSNDAKQQEKEMKILQISIELEELQQRKQRTQTEIAGMENMTLKQRFQDILQNLNKDIKLKELEYQKLLSQK